MRLSIIAVYLVIAAIIAMSLLPFATGKVKVSIPEEGGSEPQVSGNQVIMTVPVDITNDGYFDIQDLTVRFRIADGAKVITERSSVPVDVIAGRTNHLNLSIVIDLDTVGEESMKDLVFNATILSLEVGVEAGYSLGLVKASISSDQDMEWEPLVNNVNVDTGSIRWENNGTNVDVLVPYHFDASSFAQGKTVGIVAQLSNSSAVLGTASEDLIIGPSNDGQLRFVVSQETFLWLQAHPQALTLDASLSLMGATMHLDKTISAGGVA